VPRNRPSGVWLLPPGSPNRCVHTAPDRGIVPEGRPYLNGFGDRPAPSDKGSMWLKRVPQSPVMGSWSNSTFGYGASRTQPRCRSP
jgi:hypothetical protein